MLRRIADRRTIQVGSVGIVTLAIDGVFDGRISVVAAHRTLHLYSRAGG